MEQFLKELSNNLIIIGVGIVIFAICYLSNIVVSIWKDIKINMNSFDWKKLFDGVVKYAVLCFGIALMCVGITSIPVYCNVVGIKIADEFVEYFKIITVAGAFITASCKYIVEAFGKLKSMLGGNK